MGSLSPTHKPDYSLTKPPVEIPLNKAWFDKSIKLSELDESSRNGTFVIDGKVLLESRPLLNPDGSEGDVDPGIELSTSEAAVRPVCYLPGVAERFGT